MLQINNKENCCGCSACFNACPKQCIVMKKDEEGFLYPVIDQSSCVNCGVCETVCPFNVNKPVRGNVPISYAAQNLDDDARKCSSSGGIFTALAKFVISRGGCVFGVAMSDDQKSAKFIKVDNIDDIDLLRGSKYFQAETGKIYKTVKENLDSGKHVLFSGVPCQVNGLKLYLKKNYDNLFTVEVICHGVPSPELWKKYCNHLENKYGSKISNVNFRDKRTGWHNYNLYREANDVQYFESHCQNPYMVMFLRDYCLRPSCYECNVKQLESMADITLGDFWGIEKVLPELDDDKGTSLVFIQTETGEKLFEGIKDGLTVKQVKFNDAVSCNPAYYKSVKKPVIRERFFADMNEKSFEELEFEYCKPIKVSLFRKVLRFGKRILKKIF